jgi:hypothetical protein
MNFHDLALGWREALLGVVVLLALYVLIVFRRLRRLRPPPAVAPPSAGEAGAEGETPPAPVAADPAATGERVAATYARGDFPWNEPPEPQPPEERIAALEAELGRLRGEIGALRKEIGLLEGELAVLREDSRQGLARVNEHVLAMQHVAPIYGDAMQMALAGHEAATIAERCGIARAEAELVVALIRNRDDGGIDADDAAMMGERP